jgi:ParB/RepB/Spo0J family partition protein
MATRTAESGIAMIALSQIRHDRNVRQELAASEVDALAQSIALLGQLTPVSVRPDGEGAYVLIAGHKRYAALAQLGHTEIRAEIRPDGEAEESERAAENIVRSQLNPYEEAVAVKAMLDRGLTETGAAQALGWSAQRVSARVKVLELPEAAQRMIGEGRIALSAVDQLRAIGAVSAPLLDALIVFLADGNEWAADRLAASRAGCWTPPCAPATERCSPSTCPPSTRMSWQGCGWARRPTGWSSMQRSCTRRLTATPTAPRRSGLPRRTSIRPAPRAC